MTPAEYPAVWDAAAAGRARAGAIRPLRPSLSPALPCLAAIWGSVVLVGRAGIAAEHGAAWLGADPALLTGLAMAVAACMLLICSRLMRPVAPALLMAALGLAAGTLGGAVAIEGTLAAMNTLPSAPVSSYGYLVETDPAATERGGWHFEATVLADGAPAGRAWFECDERALGDDGPPDMGAVLEATGAWREMGFGEFDASLLMRGVSARVKATRVERVGGQGGAVGAIRAWRADVLRRIGARASEERALCAGVVCGMQSALTGYDVRRSFSDLGLSHLVAVSGSHLAVVAGLSGALLSRTRLAPGRRSALQLLALAGYVVFTGLQGSAVRSWAMLACALAARSAGRRSHGVSSTAAAATVLVLVEPTYAATMGFALSVLSVLGIGLFAGLVSEWAAFALPRRCPPDVADALALTLVAQAFTLPVTVPAFSTIPLLSPVANIVVGPLVSLLMAMGLVCLPASAAVGGASPALAGALLVPCDMVALAVCRMAGALASVPFACMVAAVDAAPLAFALVAGAIALYAAWPAPSLGRISVLVGVPLAVAGVCWVSWRFFAPARIVVLDVGQGDAILVQEGAAALLVDTGPDDAVLLALSRQHVVHLDAVLLTHTDLDHVGGLTDLAGRVGIGEVIVAAGVTGHIAQTDPDLGDAMSRACGGEVLEVGFGDHLEVGSYDLEVLAPQGRVDGDENEDSIVLRASYGGEGGPGRAAGFTALLTGDAESPQIEPLIDEGLLGHVDLYKAGHHGSKPSLSQKVVRATTPAVVVASAGAGNRYGHPSERCRELAASAGSAFFCTIDSGDVDIRPGPGAPAVDTAR